jgi:hypothetical protein
MTITKKAKRYRHTCPDCTRRLTCHLGPYDAPDLALGVNCPVHGMGVAAYNLQQSPYTYQTIRQRKRRKMQEVN